MPREVKATLEFGDGIYVSHVWFVSDGQRDWLAALLKFPGDDFFTLRYRFRYYKSDDVNDNTEKSGIYIVETRGEEATLAADIDWLIETTIVRGFGRLVVTDKVTIQSADTDTVMLALRDKRWVHGTQPNAPGGAA